MSRRSIVAANWKMNGDLALVDTMANAMHKFVVSDNVDVVICPNPLYLAKFSSLNLPKFVSLGAQNASEHEKGAFTGETSLSMLKEFNVEYVIIGHSERRSIFNESNENIAEKVRQVLASNLTPILCIGESEEERTSGKTETVLASQLQPVIDNIGIEKFINVVVAYEPVWAIGTGKTASPTMAQETHLFIREFIAKSSEEVAQTIPLLYGGSVNAGNCEELFAQDDIDGGLIGGASLKADEYRIICSAAKGK